MGCSNSKPQAATTATASASQPPSNTSTNNAPATVEGTPAPVTHKASDTTKSPEHSPRKKQQQQQQPILPDEEGFHPSANGRKGHKFHELYLKTKEQLDGGNFGQIFKCQHQQGTRDVYWKIGAVKVTKPNALDTYSGPIYSYDDVEDRCQEIRTLALLQRSPISDHILRLQEYFYDRDSRELMVVTELLEMNLRDWIDQQEQFTEWQGRTVASVILDAIQFMHNRGIIHRDIKEANVVFRNTGDLRTLKVVDFGLAKDLQPGQTEKAFCGSLGYIAPEIYMKERYAFEVDLFSFGVLMFKILSGKRPWPAGPAEETGRRTVNLEYRIVADEWQGVSRNGRNFIRQLLVFKEERLSAEQAYQHEWLNEQTATVLRIGASNRSGLNQSPSDAVANPEGVTQTQEFRDGGTRFWIEDSVQNALSTFSQHRAFHGHFMSAQNGHVLIEEYIPEGATLLPYFIQDRLELYTERECRHLCREVALRIKQFHDANVVHRKLHMENIVVESQMGRRDFNVSIRGFQYAQMIREDQPLTGRVGRLNQMKGWRAFIAPEIESEFYHDKRVDLWSLGAIIYMCLCGTAPVRPDLYFNIVVPSVNAQNLVRKLLQRDPSRRLTIDEVLQHPWMVERDIVLAEEDLSLAKIFWGDWKRSGRQYSSQTHNASQTEP